jgi:hypothetical protein
MRVSEIFSRGGGGGGGGGCGHGGHGGHGGGYGGGWHESSWYGGGHHGGYNSGYRHHDRGRRHGLLDLDLDL